MYCLSKLTDEDQFQAFSGFGRDRNPLWNTPYKWFTVMLHPTIQDAAEFRGYNPELRKTVIVAAKDVQQLVNSDEYIEAYKAGEWDSLKFT